MNLLVVSLIFISLFLPFVGASSSEIPSGDANELTSFLVDIIPNTDLMLDKSSIKTETIGEIPKDVLEKKPEVKGSIAVVNAKYGTGHDARSVRIVKYKTVEDAKDSFEIKAGSVPPDSTVKKYSVILDERGTDSSTLILQATWIGEDDRETAIDTPGNYHIKYGDTHYEAMRTEKNYVIWYGSPWVHEKGSKEEVLNAFKAISEKIKQLSGNSGSQEKSLQNTSKDLNADSGAIEEKYKTFLDTNISLLATINTRTGSYKIVEYKNIIPFASGVEIFSSDGRRIEDSSKAYPILTSIAWMEAANKLRPEDIDTLKSVLQTSQQIDSAVSPVYTVTSTAVNSVKSLQNACISIPFAGKKCAWDIVTVSYPGINEFANQLGSFNSELSDWKNAASSVGAHLPNVISGFEQAKSGGDVSSLQSEITLSLSSFGALQKKTNQMSEKLSSMSSSLSNAESGLRSASSNPVVGILIKPVADTLKNLEGQVDSLKGKANSFSSTIGEQSKKLSIVTDYANDRDSELQSMWNARQNASFRIYGTIIFLILLILLIVGFVQYNKKLKAQGKTFQFPQLLDFNKKRQTESRVPEFPGTPQKIEVKKTSRSSEENPSTAPKRLKVLSSKKTETGTPQRLKVKSSKNSDDKLP